MSSLYENQCIVNSFHAVDANTGNVLTADEEGFVQLSTGQELVFVHPDDDNKHIAVNTLVFTAGDDDMLIALNGNETYPFRIPSGATKGVGYMYVSKIKALNGGDLSYEALAVLP